ncbi:MAG: SMP-30/gluconolactonase/LRE family protein [Rhodospirillales bacterium]|jgi:sugar lactone lactonase YvrE|nr:SMP-30/gluconolactonase/LRE family protein [Rhodospirillales bacterium]MDP6883925.1 SMP-30/gluconolactonase/LRE family protein [Rhodospirillales bacterium]
MDNTLAGKEVRCILDARDELGESIVWCAEEGALYRVDILAPAIHRLDTATGAVRSWPMPAPIGSLGLREGGGAVVALKNGFHFFDFEGGSLTFIVDPEPDRPDNRLNDGKVGPDGRFWAGSMDDRADKEAVAALYRLDVDGSCHKMADGLIVSNGLAWSPDGLTLYHSDTRLCFIHAYDYDMVGGSLGQRRLIAEPTDAIGRPDGAAVDVEGCYWSSGISAGRINRFRPDGTLDGWIEMPVPAPTMCCFGGPDLKTLYITTKRVGLSAEVLAAYPQSGGVFSVDVGIEGVPVSRFKG